MKPFGKLIGRPINPAQLKGRIPFIEVPAMRLPRLRFSVRSMMLAVAGMAVALAYLASGSTRLGCGSVGVLLRFDVVDDRDGRPIAGATIALFHDLSAPPLVAVCTDADGAAAAVCRPGCTW